MFLATNYLVKVSCPPCSGQGPGPSPGALKQLWHTRAAPGDSWTQLWSPGRAAQLILLSALFRFRFLFFKVAVQSWHILSQTQLPPSLLPCPEQSAAEPSWNSMKHKKPLGINQSGSHKLFISLHLLQTENHLLDGKHNFYVIFYV